MAAIKRRRRRKAQSLLEQVRETAERGAHTLDECIRRVEDRLASSTDYDDKMASHLAYLMKHVTQILSELRRLEAHETQAVRKKTDAERDQLVRQYLADLSPDRRASIRAFLDEITPRVL